MKRKSSTPWLPFWSSSWYFLSYVRLGSPFTTSLYKRHVADEDLSIPELSPRNKRNRRKLYLQLAESMVQLWLAEWKWLLTINLYSIDNSFHQRRFFRAYGKAGIRNRKRNRKRKRKRNWNPNPNLRNKNWGRFCLKSVTNNNCSIKTFHPHIIFIYCYYIFYCRIFCVRGKIFLREFHIRVSVTPPFAAFPSQWMKHGALLTKGTSKNIQCYQKMLPFYKNISVFVYRSRQSDESIEIWIRVKMWSCCALNLCSSLRRNTMGWFFEF